MKKTYQFDVPCVYYYEIDANTEEEARLILNKKGGIEIEGELCLESENYNQAQLVGILDPIMLNPFKKESEEINE